MRTTARCMLPLATALLAACGGAPVLADGEHTGATPGRVLRGPGWSG